MDMLMKEKEENDLIISKLKYELEQKNKTQEDYCFQLENLRQAIVKLMKEKKSADLMMAKLMEEKNKSDEQVCPSLFFYDILKGLHLFCPFEDRHMFKFPEKEFLLVLRFSENIIAGR